MIRREKNTLLWIGAIVIGVIGLTLAITKTVDHQNTADGYTLTFAASEEERTIFTPMIEEFNQQYPGYRVQFVSIPSDQSLEVKNTAETADVILLPGQSLDTGDGYFRDLQPLIEAEKGFSGSDFWPGAFRGCQGENNSLLGIPLSLELSGIYIDQEAFTSVGLALPGSGWTWSDFTQVVQELSQENTNRFVLLDQLNLADSILAPIIDVIITDESQTFSSQALADRLNWYFTGIQNGMIYPFKSGANSQQGLAFRENLFFENPPVMWVGSINASLPGIRGRTIDENVFLPFPVDANDPNKGTTPIHTRCIAMSSGTKDVQVAWDWIKFLSDRWGKTGSINPLVQFPARKSIADSIHIWASLPQGTEASVRFILNHGWFGPTSPQVFADIEKGLQNGLTGGATLESAINTALQSKSAETSPTQFSAPVIVSTPKSSISDDDKVELRFYGLGGKYTSQLEALAENFEDENPETSILFQDIDGISPDAGHDPITLAEQQTDCFLMNTGASGEGVLSLNPFIDQEPIAFTKDFYAGLTNNQSFGNLYSLPAFNRPLLMYFNPNLLNSYGLSSPSTNWTFEEFVEMITAVGSTHSSEKIYGFLFESGWSDPLFLAGRGSLSFDSASEIPEVALDTPEMRNSLSWLAGLHNSGVFITVNSENYREVENMVAGGKLAFWVSPMGAPFAETSAVSFQPGVAALPVTQTTNPLLSMGSEYGYYISIQSKYPNECWNWIKYLSEHWTISDAIPMRRSLAGSQQWEAQVGAQNAQVYRSALEQVIQARQFSYNPVLDPLISWQSQVVGLALAGNPPEPILTNLQQQADAYLDCIHGLGLTEANRLSRLDEIQGCATTSVK
ncbi:MAG TPA: hypothetical protein DD636_04840 [Anaerolineaceae bacterium]|jgi:ABC-type glycerol-3-phosphate transport system substrate-binding protein|nr:hypothetical protein [Anaerolineaceae bacterium]